MKKILQTIDLSHFFSISFLVMYAVSCLFLHGSGKVYYLIHKDYAWLLLASGIGLGLLAIMEIMHVLKKQICKGCGDFFSVNRGSILIILLPLVLGLILPPKPLSSSTAQSRLSGYNNDLGFSREVQTTYNFHIQSEKRTLMDWIRLFGNDPEPDNYKGLKANIRGFVLKDQSLPEHHFLIAQFVMSCCSADARPIGIPVQYDPAQFILQNDQWIEMEAIFDTAVLKGERQPVLLLKNFKPIPVPQNPYANE